MSNMTLQQILTDLADPELIEALESYQRKHIPAFLELRAKHPLSNHLRQYVSLGEAFWLYRIAVDLAPDLIVESGTMDGYSAWWLSQADPDLICTHDPAQCPIYEFDWVHYADLDFSHAEYKPTERSLVFFDDHQSPSCRLEQAMNMGFRHLCFHDIYPTSNLYEFRQLKKCSLHQLPRIRDPKPFRDHSENRWLTYLIARS